jgi:hypothetical protein
VEHIPAHGIEASPKVLLGELLRLARQQSEYKTQDALSGVIGLERTGITRGETGDRVPNVSVLSDWLAACGVSGLARTAIEGVAKLARLTDDAEPVKVWFSGYLDAEGKAHTLRLWQPLIFHGLFQTEPYTRALFLAAGASEDQIQKQAALRAERQAILASPGPPNIIALVDESVLNRLIGSPEVMREQVTRILELSGQIVVQVVPGRIGANAGLGGAITLAAATGTPEVLAAEALVEDQVTQDTSQVLQASVTFDRVRADALPRVDSRAVMQEALKRWNS